MLWMTFALGLTACNEQSFHRSTQEDVFRQERWDAIDILFVIDDSVSMQQEQELVAQGFYRFIEAVDDEELDFHLGVTTTNMDDGNPERGALLGEPPWLTPQDDYLPAFMERVQGIGTGGSDKEQGLAAAWHAMQVQENQGFVRQGAALALLFVSDENDCSNEGGISDAAHGAVCYDEDAPLTPANQFIRGFQDLKGAEGRVVVSAIIGPEVDEGCEDAWPGHRYETVAETLDGVTGSICRSDYEDLLGSIGERIVGPIRVFQLTYIPVLESLTVEVDGELIEQDPVDGWTYDEEYWMLRFDGVYVPPPASVLTVNYTVAGG